MLLTIATEPGKDHLIHIDLVFEGDAQIQLRTDRIACRLDDFGDAGAVQGDARAIIWARTGSGSRPRDRAA